MFDIFINVDQTINACGLRCPEPIMILRKTIRNLVNGQMLLFITDDHSTTRDIPRFCQFMEHTLLAQSIKSIPYRYLLCKGADSLISDYLIKKIKCTASVLLENGLQNKKQHIQYEKC